MIPPFPFSPLSSPLSPSLIPHSLYPPEETEVCLFARTDKKTAKELLERKGVKAVKKVILSHFSRNHCLQLLICACFQYAHSQQVIPLDKLKTDYKSFESKKHLSVYYDVYLADRRVYHLLSRHLGKSFFAKKK